MAENVHDHHREPTGSIAIRADVLHCIDDPVFHGDEAVHYQPDALLHKIGRAHV